MKKRIKILSIYLLSLFIFEFVATRIGFAKVENYAEFGKAAIGIPPMFAFIFGVLHFFITLIIIIYYHISQKTNKDYLNIIDCLPIFTIILTLPIWLFSTYFSSFLTSLGI